MTSLESLLADAKTALETIHSAADRGSLPQHGVASADWLEQIARNIRAEINKQEAA